MKGLIKKDLLFLKRNIKTLAILFIMYVFLAFNGEMDLSFFLSIMSVMIMISTFSYDSYNRWDSYVIALPNGRKNSVKAKYIVTILLIIATTLITFIFTIIITYVRTKSVDYENILSTTLGSFFATTLLQSFMYPSIYKFGVEKARIGIFVGVFGIAILISIITQIIDFKPFLKSINVLNEYYIFILPIIIVIMLYISYKISEKIYLNKEY